MRKNRNSAREGSDGARDLLVLSNLRLVKSIVEAFRGCGIEPNDLFSEGVKGLVKATKRYRPDKGRFATYVRHTIRGGIMDYIDKNRTFTHVPKPLRKEVNRFRETLEKLGGTATDATLAEDMGCSLEKIRYLRICSEQSTYSLSVPLADADMDPPEWHGGYDSYRDTLGRRYWGRCSGDCLGSDNIPFIPSIRLRLRCCASVGGLTKPNRSVSERSLCG